MRIAHTSLTLVPYFKEYSTQKFSPVQDLNVKLRGGWEHTIVKTLIFKWRACSAHAARSRAFRPYIHPGKNSAGEPTRPLKPKAYLRAMRRLFSLWSQKRNRVFNLQIYQHI